MTFVKAKAGPPIAGDPDTKFTVQYFDEQGNMTIRTGGTRAWRCNNLGALLKSSYSIGKDRRAITEYLVHNNEESIWLSKQDAIKLTIEGKLHATLVHLKNGNHYLRPEHGQHGFVIIT